MLRLRPRIYKKWLNGNDTPYYVQLQRMRNQNRRNVDREERYERAPVVNEREPPAFEIVAENNHHERSASLSDGDTEDSTLAEEGSLYDSVSGIEEDQSESEQEATASAYKDTESLFEKLGLGRSLEPLHVSRFEVLLMVLTIVMRHGMTGPLVEDLLTFVNILVGYEVLPKSYHMFQKIFSVNSALNFHFVCHSCNLYLGEHKSFTTDSVDCPNCSQTCNVKPTIQNEGTFFVTLSLRNQLQDLMKRVGHLIMPRLPRDENVISDIYDGELYKSLCEEGMPLSNPYALSLIMGTDGGNVFKTSCRNSMWPVQFVCNELDPKERFRPENMLLGGIWFGSKSPEMSAFLKPISTELKLLAQHGVQRTLNNGQVVSCPVQTILCNCDTVAKPKLQNMMQFNGYYGCGYCLHPGTVSEDCPQVRYPCDGKNYKLRSQESWKKAMTLAAETGNVEKGVKGFSPLLLFPFIHLVFGIPIDYMHAILLGVMKRLVSLWFEDSSHGKGYYIKNFESEFESRLSSIIPPSKTSTRPKALSKRSQWKAKDWGNFLLFYGLPSLKDILPQVYWENFQDLSNGIYLLLKDSIDKRELRDAELFLSRFVETYNRLYGDENMVHCIHLITHLTTTVNFCGPLSMYSAFSFESGIGLLVRLVKGTDSVASQICRKYLASKSLPYLLKSFEINPSVQDFCSSVLTFSRNKFSELIDGVTLLGRQVTYFPTQEDRQLLSNSGFRFGDYVLTYNRVIYKGNVYTSTSYTRPTKTNDSCVKLLTGNYGLIDHIILVQEPQVKCVIILRQLRVCPGFELARHLLICAGDPLGEKIIVNFSEVETKCIFFSVEGKKYITQRPNKYEKDM